MWTMRRTVIAGERLEDDWVIVRGFQEVGRVRHDSVSQNGAAPWTWATWTLPAEHGRADTLEAAREALRQAVLQAAGG
ncbi:hypothetical protein ACUXV3_12370 [Roseobacteraceae bacterium NS-SX3]